METFSKHTRFILTCNYVEKIIDPIQSRCQVFGITPPSRKDVAVRLSNICKEENVTLDDNANNSIVSIVTATYPDIRRGINALQRQVVNNEIVIDKASLLESEYVTKILSELTGGKSFTTIRKIVADSQVKNFEDLYRFLFESVDEYAKDVAACILILAESQYQSAFSVDKEINIMGMFYKLLQETK
tara:strand:- start:1876 stop:2436 length:561 start_codon:yes stop_codon:yes gene_type:complete